MYMCVYRQSPQGWRPRRASSPRTHGDCPDPGALLLLGGISPPKGKVGDLLLSLERALSV